MPGSIADPGVGARVGEQQAHGFQVPAGDGMEEWGLALLVYEVNLQVGPGEQQAQHLGVAGKGGLAERRPAHGVLEVELQGGVPEQEREQAGMSALGGQVQGAVAELINGVDFEPGLLQPRNVEPVFGRGADQNAPEIVIVAVVGVGALCEQQFKGGAVAQQTGAVERGGAVVLLRIDADPGAGKQLAQFVLGACRVGQLVEQGPAVAIRLVHVAAGDF